MLLSVDSIRAGVAIACLGRRRSTVVRESKDDPRRLRSTKPLFLGDRDALAAERLRGGGAPDAKHNEQNALPSCRDVQRSCQSCGVPDSQSRDAR